MPKKTLKKKLKKKTAAKPKVSMDQLTGPVLESAQEIWRAGLGALALAQREGGKAVSQGSAMFEQLVAEGARVEKEGRAAVDQGADAVRKKLVTAEKQLEQNIEAVGQTVEDRWDHLEGVFEQRVMKVVKGMGLATAAELRALADRVEALGSGDAGAAGPRVLHLLPGADGWSLREEGSDRDLETRRTKKEALKTAREVAQASVPSRLVIHRADGTVQDQVSYDLEG
jgi:poly(hydroxyalkanoate) granule-associated protein